MCFCEAMVMSVYVRVSHVGYNTVEPLSHVGYMLAYFIFDWVAESGI